MSSQQSNHRQPAVLILFAILVTSSVEFLAVDFGGATLSIATLLCLFSLAAIFISSRAIPTAFLRAWLFFLVVLACVTVIASIGAETEPALRLKQIIQVVIGMLCLLATYVLASESDSTTIRRIVNGVSIGVSVAALVELIFRVLLGQSSSGSRFLGLPRPTLGFQEPAWLATYAAVLLAIAVSLRLRTACVVLALLLLVIFTRAALLLAIPVLLVSLPPVRRVPLLCAAIAGVPIISSIWFFVQTVTAVPDPGSFTSLDTRIRDSWTIRVINNDDLFPFGGIHLDLDKYDTWRSFPSTSNILGFDLIWKFGLFGVAFLLAYWIMIGYSLPRAAAQTQPGVPVEPYTYPLWVALCILPATMQYNNSLGRPWSWILIGLTLGVIHLIQTDSASRSQQLLHQG